MGRFQILIIMLILILPGCKSHKNVVATNEIYKDNTNVKHLDVATAYASVEWITKVFTADSLCMRIEADSVAMGALYNPRVVIEAIRPSSAQMSGSDVRESANIEARDSVRSNYSERDCIDEESGSVGIVEPIEKKDWRWLLALPIVTAIVIIVWKRIKMLDLG